MLGREMDMLSSQYIITVDEDNQLFIYVLAVVLNILHISILLVLMKTLRDTTIFSIPRIRHQR